MLGERVQSLWSGYGEVRRAELLDAPLSSAIVKHVLPPRATARSAAEERSHRRKLRSYRVECAFYREYAPRCPPSCRVPAAIHAEIDGDRTLLVLEDLDAAGFGLRRSGASEHELEACLAWLAAFHATFLGVEPQALWKAGTYWHLATRPDEHRALGDRELQRAAPELDERLRRARHRTLVHGDAKLANFCFRGDGGRPAAVDFQYVGGGVGVQDVAYFLTSCASATVLERDAERYLDEYFRALGREVAHDIGELEAEWRALYPVACADFYRFLLGWAGEQDARDAYLERMTRQVLRR